MTCISLSKLNAIKKTPKTSSFRSFNFQKCNSNFWDFAENLQNNNAVQEINFYLSNIYHSKLVDNLILFKPQMKKPAHADQFALIKLLTL